MSLKEDQQNTSINNSNESEEMEELTECESEFSSAALLNSSELGENEEHDEPVTKTDAHLHYEHKELYKYTGTDGWTTQEKRRQIFLDNQKKKRSRAFDEKRDLNEIFMVEQMEVEGKSTIHKYKNSKKNPFKVMMMDSEWLIHLPDDLQDNWIVKFCVDGTRVLVVTHKGNTYCYYKNGRQFSRFRSRLPGGGFDKTSRFTVLDCIYSHVLNVLFVYDVIAWNSLSLVDLEAQHRFSWLKTKFQESPEMLVINEKNNFKFVLVDSYPARNDIIQEQLFSDYVVNDSRIPFTSILFFHEEGHYVFESSPLVGWLKIFMLPEILHIDVPEIHIQNKPNNYVSAEAYIIDKNLKKWHNKRNKAIFDVDMVSVEPTY